MEKTGIFILVAFEKNEVLTELINMKISHTKFIEQTYDYVISNRFHFTVI